MIKRSITLLLISFSPFLVNSQGNKTSEEGSKAEEEIKNQLGLGVHLLPKSWLSKLHPRPVILQVSYKRPFEHFTFRSGIGFGKEVGNLNNEGVSQSFLLINSGLERSLWSPGHVYRLSLGLAFTLTISHGMVRQRRHPEH